jgi:transposase
VDQIYDRVAGLDVHRDNVVACFRRLGPRGGVLFEKDRFRSTTAGLRELEAWLAERRVELVAMEATGVYWKPVYYALESRFTGGVAMDARWTSGSTRHWGRAADHRAG